MQFDIKDLTEIGGTRILEYVILTPEMKRSGRTRHITGGEEQINFSGLAICKYEDLDGVYLFYCDSNWTELTDTWHEDVQSAKNQAAFEYEGLENKWIKK